MNDLLGEIENSPSSEKVRIWGLSGAGFVVRADDEVVYIDPYLVVPDPSRPHHRAGPVPFPPERVRKANAILSTHEHEDHCNGQTLLGINRSTHAKFMGPKSATKKALSAGYPSSQVITVEPGEEHEISPLLHLKVFQAKDPYEESAVMYILETPRGNLFHSGDTSYFEEFKKIGDNNEINVALLNFGKQIPTPEKPYYMNAEKLALAARDLRANIVVPMHWNLWIEAKEDPRPIEPILKSKSPESKLVIIELGEKLEL